ncbi:hypothetical protein [Bradyrhizobium liaoningense]|uniref:hypothetical protein n=1 Tax=Bradyrhizobium liaoningense TaxID=43992 RepID=UPI001BA85CB0|nr:hypothetical protein [Bradyrhizobium liaoningense]MBR1034181.1 hypothetical protein [Bradyrhizobium liaoningense]
MWDDSLIELQAYSWGSYADTLDGTALPPAEGGPYNEVRIAAWANDTHALGIMAYQPLRAGTPAASDPAHAVELGDAYAVAVKADLNGQMMKSASRLKAVLEDVLAGP